MLVAVNTVKELEKIKKGSPYSFQFILKNDGQSSVLIDRISVGCGSCTKASTSKVNVNPGETSSIDVVFTPGSTGTQQKFVNVQWNGDNLLKLTFTADSYE